MLPKIIETDPYLMSKNGSSQKTVVFLDEYSFSSNFEKIASEALNFAKTLSPTPGKTKILVLAMGASEYYGPNRNGDAFKESELISHHHTFKTNANVFRSHVNKDPAKSIGKVIESFYNHDMHRVELILELDNGTAANEVEKIRQNKDVAVSMGCRIKYDVCSICGNKAPTRAEYCTHLKYEMGEVHPDGRIVCADNPKPNFFDISIVFRPADKTGYMMKKIARDGSILVQDKSADLAIKNASLTVLAAYLRKAADIDKTISGVAVGIPPSEISTKELSASEKSLSAKWISTLTPKVVDAYTSIGKDSLSNLSRDSFIDTLKVLSESGVFLMTSEFLELMFNKLLGKSVPDGLPEKLVSLQKDIFTVLSKHPEIPSSAIEDKVVPTFENEKLSLDICSRNSLSGYKHTVFPKADLDYATCKLAGYGAVLYAAYSASLLETTEPSVHKLASLHDVELSFTPRKKSFSSKLSYLEHRTMDMFKNHGTFCKLSSNSVLNNIDLFKKSPEDYYVSVGHELILI
jgi:hypothetical protein